MPSTATLDRDLPLATGATLLGLKVGPHEISEPGAFVAKGDAQSQPTCTLPATSAAAASDKRFIVLSLDLDAPTPTINMLSPILHFLGVDFTADAAGVLSSSTPPYASWVAPAPPLPPSPHRYVLFVYEQPAAAPLGKYRPAASAAKLGNFPRMRWDLDAFAKEIGLGPAVAVNYFNSR